MNNIGLKITAFIFGIALWFFVMSQQDFQITMDVPVKLVKLPEMLSIASKPPLTLPVTIKGPAFDLIRLRAESRSKKSTAVAIVIDLANAELGSMRKHIDSNNFMAPNFPNIKLVDPANQLLFIDIDIDTRIHRDIPIRSNITIEPAPGYILTDAPQILPNSITVSGARNAITRIIEIPTDSIRYDSLTTDSDFTIPLNFNQFPSYVRANDSVVNVSIDIQKISTRTFESVPIQLIGVYSKDSTRLLPDTMTVEITGGDKILNSISKQDIELFVEINRFAIEDVDSLAPTVKLNLATSINRDMSIKGIRLIPDKTMLKKTEAKVVPVDSLGEE